MASLAPLKADQPQQQPSDAVASIHPPLPAGLEADLRAYLAALNAAPFNGKGHVTVRIDRAPGKPASWAFDIGGIGQERK